MSPTTTALTVGSNNTPAFLADATSSIDKMEAYANLLIKSGLVPKHFYELDQYRNPMKDANGVFKGNTAAVIMTIQHGLELGMSITQSLQQIVPVNGLMSVKGDAAKALIMRSGLCKEWIEDEVGTPGTDTYGYKIVSKRTDGQFKSQSFTVQDAKRAGLWIDDNAVAKNEKLRHSPWYKYQSRMLRYRALGFIARDLYGDVLQNMYTEDEARDIETDNTVTTTADGMTVRVSEDKSAKINEAAADALKDTKPAKGKKKEEKAIAKLEEEKRVHFEEAFIVTDEVEAATVETESSFTDKEAQVYTKAELDAMDAKDVFQICKDTFPFDIEKLFEGANKAKRFVGWIKKLVLARQDGSLEQLLKTEFKISLADLLETKSEPVKGEPKADTIEGDLFPIPDFGEDGKRAFEDYLSIHNLAKERNVTKEMIMGYVKENGLEFNTYEGFYEGASAEHIRAALGL